MSHTQNAIVVNEVRGRQRDVHFNTIVRDLSADCLTKFDRNLITVEWPIVVKLCIFKSSRILADDVIDIENEINAKTASDQKLLSRRSRIFIES